MKNIILISGIVFFILFSCVNRTFAQTDSCIIRLKTAAGIFENGDYDGTIKLLNLTMSKCNLAKEDKIQAGKLLILSYLRVDKLEEAEKMAEEIIKINPYYKPDKFKDDPKLSAIFERYRSVPVFRVGINGGLNYSNVDVVKTYSIVHPDDSNDLGKYSSKPGFQLGAYGEYRIYRELWLNLGFGFRQSRYEHLLFDVDGTTIDYSEKLSYFDIPLNMKYCFLKSALQPYLEIGADAAFLSSSISTSIRNDSKDLVDRTNFRTNFTLGVLGGAGLAYSQNELQFFAGIRYVSFPDKVNKDGTRYADAVNVFKYYYIDDDFKMNNLLISAGVSFVLDYRNKKVK